MPRGIRKNPAAQKRGKPAKRLNKTEAVRRALDTLGPNAKPLEIKAYLKDVLDTDMKTTLISSYKTSLARKAAGTSSVVRKPKNELTAAPVTAQTGGDKKLAGNIDLDDIQAVKELTERL